MKRLLALLLSGALALLTGCAGGEIPLFSSSAAPAPSEPYPQLVSQAFLPKSSRTVESALAGFGLELLQRTRNVSGEKPALVSPLSVTFALALAANGADGDTLTQFETVLAGGATLDELNAACAQLTGDYHNLDGSTECTIANSLWKDCDGGIYEDFVSRCKGGYGAQVYEASLSDARIVGDVNRWVSKHTNKLIPRIIEEPFQENTALLLVNALYLKNKFAAPFDPLNTREREFHHADGSTSREDFLARGHTDMLYLQGQNAQGVVLPYDDGRLGFFALLPDLYPDAPSFGDWLDALHGDDLVPLIDGRTETQFLAFAMPKFQVDWKGDLTAILPEMGLDRAFVAGEADFSRMGSNPEGYYISKVVHATRLEVNEKGTEAAAATVVAANGSGAAPENGVTLILDRPFLYGIVDLDKIGRAHV